MRKFCPDCGKELKKGEFYCKECNPDFEKEFTSEEIENIQQQYEKGNKKGCLLLIGIGLIAAVVLFAIYLFGGEEGLSAAVLNFVFIGINVVLYKLKKRERTLKTNYYNLTLKETASPSGAAQTAASTASTPVQQFCGNCGTKLEAGAKFCGNCGTQL